MVFDFFLFLFGFVFDAHKCHSIDDRAQVCDPLTAIVTSFWLIYSVWPLFITNALVLLQTCPASLVSNLDKCLREIAVIEGMLEYGGEHFWTISNDEVQDVFSHSYS